MYLMFTHSSFLCTLFICWACLEKYRQNRVCSERTDVQVPDLQLAGSVTTDKSPSFSRLQFAKRGRMIACGMGFSQSQTQSFFWKSQWLWYFLPHVVLSGVCPSCVDPVNVLVLSLSGQELGAPVPRALSILRRFRRGSAEPLTLESTCLRRP